MPAAGVQADSEAANQKNKPVYKTYIAESG